MVYSRIEIKFTAKSIRPGLELIQGAVQPLGDAIVDIIKTQHMGGYSISGNKFPKYKKSTIAMKSKALGVNAKSITENLRWSGSFHFIGRKIAVKYSSLSVGVDFSTSYTKTINFRRFEDFKGNFSPTLQMFFLNKMKQMGLTTIFKVNWKVKYNYIF